MGQAKDVTERWWTLYLAGKIDEAQALYVSDLHFRGPGVEFNSREAIRPYLDQFYQEFDNYKRQTKHTVEDGDRIFLEVEIEMRHKASNKTVKIYATDFVRVVNGKIVTWTATWDRAGFGGQLQ